MVNPISSIRSVLATLPIFLLSGCGGVVGAAVSAATSTSPSASVSTNTVSVSANVSDASAPTAIITVSVAHASGSLYLCAASTMNGITGAGTSAFQSGSAQVTIGFRTPRLLAPGTYSDTITLSVGTNPNCTNQVSGSPMSVSSNYIVKTSTGAQAPTLSLSSTTVFYQALPTDAGPP